MNYRSVVAKRFGGPEVLQVMENELRMPAAGEVRIRVLAASVCRPDITSRRGEGLYSGTRLGQKTPFVPGYSVIGDVDAIGDGVRDVAVGDRVAALTVVGGYSEYLYWKSDRLIHVPVSLNPTDAVPLILNYIVVFQVLHRAARVKPGEKVLIIGASGGIGTAALQLGQLAGLKMYGMASKGKHEVLKKYGAVPIDYRGEDFVKVMQEMEPAGVDVVVDGMMRLEMIQKGLPLLNHGGRWVSFGEPESLSSLRHILGTALKTNLMPNGRHFKLYGTSFYFLGNRKPFLEDWASLFGLMETGKLKPVIAEKFALLEAARANELLESGQVIGNIVLAAQEYL